MKRLPVAGLLIFFALTSAAQTGNTKYYKNAYAGEEVPREKAKYAQTITDNPDGSISKEWKNLKKNQVESRAILKGDEPVGIWVYMTLKGPEEMDYDFTLEYTDQECPKDIAIKNFFADEPGISYEAPKLATGMLFDQFVSRNIIYPAKARREGLQGKIDLIFDLTQEGTLKNIRVKEGLHVVLDKEAVRVVRKMKLSSPAKINGTPQNLCGTASIWFRLG